ncbi:MAG: hypothetical protein LLF83_10430 [Methanobacterium sp.]|nr:hypothetical protein [Methanobacterium sp.]
MVDNERSLIIKKLKRYKSSVESKENSLMEELSLLESKVSIRYKDGLYEVEGEFKDLELDIYNNPYETYLLAQIKIVKVLPSLIDRHIICLKKGHDLDVVLESLEFEIYKIKKEAYVNIKEWEDLLKHLSDSLLMEIENNPKGPGDFIIKELCWIRDYEERWR